MGTGNYSHPDGDTVILDLYDGLHEQCEDDDDLLSILAREAFTDFQAELETILKGQTGLDFTMDGETWRDRNALVLASGTTFEAWSHEDSYGHVFLTVGLRRDLEEDQEDIARASLPAVTSRIFDALGELYELRVATSAWTSAPRRQELPAAA